MDILFRIITLIVLLLLFLISGTFRRKARKSGQVIDRRQEGIFVLVLRLGLALPLLSAILLSITYPRALLWSQVDLPLWLRWIGAGVAVSMVPFLLWTFRSIGRNISETVLTKEDHELVTKGPYRWIRHPLYAGSLLIILSFGLMSQNWILLLYAFVGSLLFRMIVIPAEEKELILAFGDEYRSYKLRTGALFPRIV